MPGFVIDRREQHRDKSSTSRDRFIKRYKEVIKKAAADTVKKAKGFSDLTTGKEGQEHEITIDRKTLDEPQFIHGSGGDHEFVLGGNIEYILGDQIQKPRDGQGGKGNEGSPDGEGEDDFTFYLSREEFLNLILDDLALPDMVKKNLAYSVISEYVHAGFTKQGSPGNMDVMRSFKQSLSRRIGLSRNHKKRKLLELEAWLEELMVELEAHPENLAIKIAIDAVEKDIITLRNKMKVMPFFDPNNDMRYRHRELERKPSVSAVMFCVMDVSGSMTENMKMHAKYFFMLLHLFLKKNYNNVDVVFVRHTSHAEEVTEEVFFYDRETGGTVVSSALEKVNDIIKERYDASIWNIYIAQASDGDNYGADSGKCQHILEDQLLKVVQYMVYVEMSDGMREYWMQHGTSMNSSSDLWRSYEKVAAKNENLKMRAVGDKSEIYPVFRELFEKKANALI
jgi:uncharacterized sporulation protein YeaH/YhbH (DUF444 family)